jgi:hypothetical protein
MGLICNLGAWSKTTLVDVVEDAEKREAPKMDTVVLGMENGKTVAIIVITADREIDTEIAAFRRQIEEV